MSQRIESYLRPIIYGFFLVSFKEEKMDQNDSTTQKNSENFFVLFPGHKRFFFKSSHLCDFFTVVSIKALEFKKLSEKKSKNGRYY